MFPLLKENIRIALDSIKGQVLRTVLTVLIIAIGITALVAILTLVGALENTISGNFASMGSNTFNIQRYQFVTRNRGRRKKVNPIISYRNVRQFKDKFQYPYTKTSIYFTGTRLAEVKYESKKTEPEVSILGINENYLDNTGTEIDSGRNFNIFDIDNNNHVCLLGSDFTKTLFDGINPINKLISIRGVKFKIIGVLKSKGSTFRNNQDLRVLIPLQVARSMYTLPNINYNISIKVSDKKVIKTAEESAVQLFRNIRGLSPLEKNNFGIERSDDLLNRIASIGTTLNIAGFILGIITVFGSSIALLNIMLVSVTERTREIGIRKALGAKRSTIASQFFIEAITISQIGNVFGIIGGIIAAYYVAENYNLTFSIPWKIMILASIISLLVGLIFGLYPAVKAAKQDPIESLRYE